MRLAVVAFLIQLVCAPASLAMANRGVTLDSLRWKHRVLLLPATQKASGCADWIANSSALRDRHLVLFRENDGEYRQWFPKPSSPTTLELSTKMRARVAGGVTLIGKDGGVKRQWKAEFCELPAAVFSLIDSMPMRQREMRREKEAPGECAAKTC